jgi:hypothetical protein
MRISHVALINSGWKFQKPQGQFNLYYRLDADGRATFLLHCPIRQEAVNIYRAPVPKEL